MRSSCQRQEVRSLGMPLRASILLRLPLLDALLELAHDGGVAQGGDVAQGAALGDIAQQHASSLFRNLSRNPCSRAVLPRTMSK